MPSTRTQNAKERRSRQLDIMSDVKIVDLMLSKERRSRQLDIMSDVENVDLMLI